MIKKITELTKEEKLLLLKAIANEEIDKKTLNEDTLICIEKGDLFLGLMMSSSQEENATPLNIVCIGKAKKEENAFFDCIRLTNDVYGEK